MSTTRYIVVAIGLIIMLYPIAKALNFGATEGIIQTIGIFLVATVISI